MKKYCIILIYIALYAVLTSCAGQDDVMPEPKGEYHFDLLIRVGQRNGMRMANEVIQAKDQPFRGLQRLQVIPFRANDEVTVNDNPLISNYTNSEVQKIDGNNYYYFIVNCSLMQGTNRLLVYGQAAPVEDMESPAQNGQLDVTLGDRMSPGDISFSLSPIRNTTDVHEDAQALADYMTAIANTAGWSTTDNAQLKGLYLDFIHADAEGSGLIGGSAAHVNAYVEALKSQLEVIGGGLSEAIIANINNNGSIENNQYPASLGLPDGAAALRWNNNAFSVRTETTTLDNINGITRYAYPAELWYYANSGIYTSVEEVTKSTYESSAWDILLTTYYKGNRYVGGDTRSVAIEKPLQYGVGRLQMTLASLPTSLNDAKNDAISTSDFKLTGVIIGGQHSVGFDFKPVGEQSDVDARFIYDPIVGNSGTVNTLVLQSYDNEKVPVILEFKNDSDQQFVGKDGIVYPGTKFYLIAQVDPAGKGDGNYANRVFTQDYITQMTMNVSTLKNAYSCMPDLLEPRLEIGVQVVTQWVQSTTTTVKL